MPALTDPSFTDVVVTADEERRLFQLLRQDVLLVVNLGEEPASVEVDGELLFTTPTPATPAADGLHLPPHSGALVRLDA